MSLAVRAIAALVLFAPGLIEPSHGDDVLFFGNSFTFGASVPGLSMHGGVPGMVEVIARAKGIDLTVSSRTWPGVDWSWHLARFTTRLALLKTWDWVVLQDYSTRPTRMGNVSQFMSDGATFSDQIARRSPHAGIVLYETWARPPGAFYKTSGGRQFSGPADMMSDLHRSYTELAKKLAAENPDRPVRVALVGTAFARCHEESPAINLDAKDEHHASPEGYYLAAMVLFETIYQQSSHGAPTDFFHGVVDVPANEAAELQRVADEVCGR